MLVEKWTATGVAREEKVGIDCWTWTRSKGPALSTQNSSVEVKGGKNREALWRTMGTVRTMV